MKLFAKLLLIGMALILTIGMIDLAIAEQPSYNEFSVPIDYKVSLVKDEQVFHDISLTLPNGLSDLVSFNINLKGDFAGAVVRGIVNTSSGIQYCDPNGWTTPNAEGYELRFDCTTLMDEVIKDKKKSPEQIGNVFNSLNITGVGYEVSKASANVYGDIKINYIDDPVGDMHVFGTEYRPGERARVFLQLKNNQGLQENNGSCILNVYYPNQVNATADPFIIDAPMLFLDGSEGLYFYDIPSLPYFAGVYMMSAGCNAQVSSAFVYFSDGTDPNSPTRTVTMGDYSSSTIVLNSYNDFGYTKCESSSGNPKRCGAVYDFDTSVHFTNTSNVTDLSLYYMGEASTQAEITFYVYNWTSNSWYNLPNNLTFSGQAVAQPTGLNDFISNKIPHENFIHPNGTIRVWSRSSSGTNFQQYDNWLNINLKTASGVIQDLKGSGEIHVNDWFNNYTGLISDAVWNWDSRTLTEFDFNVTISNVTLDEIATETTNQVWNYSGTVNTNIITQLVNALWSYIGSINTNILEQFTNSTWNISDGNGRYVNGIVIP